MTDTDYQVTFRRRWFRTPRWEAHYQSAHLSTMGWGQTKADAYEDLRRRVGDSRIQVSP